MEEKQRPKIEQKQKQRAISVGVNLNHQPDFTNSMEELKNLAEACDIEVVGEKTQNMPSLNTAHYIGKGKIEEILALQEESGADTVIFNDELTASQIRNLENDLNCEILDRTTLILEIFARRAKTREAQLQVEIARLQYMLPRLVGLRESLGRQGGGSGLKNRGSGETKLELDRRKIEGRINGLHKELDMLVARRQNQRKKRKKTEIPVIALVGYTNTGKSTLMNAMLNFSNLGGEKQVLEKDMLFATLETSVRRVELEDKRAFLLTDTVGFISKLPHHLVKAFRSTLEEVAEADVLLHVVDYANPNYPQQIEVTKKTLEELGGSQIPVIYVYNKIDLLEGETARAAEEGVYVSAGQKEGLHQLTEAIRQKVFPEYVQCELLIPYDKGNVVSYLNDHAAVKATSYEGDGVFMSLECRKDDFERYQQYVTEN